MEENFTKLVEEVGWKRQEYINFPLFTKLMDGKLYVEAMPDCAQGLVPVRIDVSEKYFIETLKYFSQFSKNMYFGDILNKFGEQSNPVDYQVIELDSLKIEKEARSQVRQAEKKGVSIRKMEGIEGYFPCIQKTAKRQGRNHIHGWTVERMLKLGGGLEAVYDGRVIGGCLYCIDGDILRYIHSSSDEDYFLMRPNHAVMDSLIEVAKDSGVKTIYLGNAPKELVGLRKFKESFGAKMKSFNMIII